MKLTYQRDDQQRAGGEKGAESPSRTVPLHPRLGAFAALCVAAIVLFQSPWVEAQTGTFPQSVAVSANTVLDSTQANRVVQCTGGTSGVTLTLSAAASFTSQTFFVFLADQAGPGCTIDPNGSETINGKLYVTLKYQYQFVWITSDGGADWHAIGADSMTGPTQQPGDSSSLMATDSFVASAIQGALTALTFRLSTSPASGFPAVRSNLPSGLGVNDARAALLPACNVLRKTGCRTRTF